MLLYAAGREPEVEERQKNSDQHQVRGERCELICCCSFCESYLEQGCSDKSDRALCYDGAALDHQHIINNTTALIGKTVVPPFVDKLWRMILSKCENLWKSPSHISNNTLKKTSVRATDLKSTFCRIFCEADVFEFDRKASCCSRILRTFQWF